MTKLLYLPMAAGFIAILFYLRPRKQDDFELSIGPLIRRLKSGLFGPLADLLHAYRVQTDRRHYISAGGFRRLLLELEQSWWKLRIIQACSRAQMTSKSEAADMWYFYILACWFTALAAVQHLLCLIIPRYPHTCAFTALGFHLAISSRLSSICEESASSAQLQRLSQIL